MRSEIQPFWSACMSDGEKAWRDLGVSVRDTILQVNQRGACWYQKQHMKPAVTASSNPASDVVLAGRRCHPGTRLDCALNCL